MFSVTNGLPGVLPGYRALHREVFQANRQFAQFVAGPVIVDGTASGNPSNAPYGWLLFAGTLMGRTSAGKFANAVLGLTTAAVTAGGNTVQLDVNTAAEVLRRIGIGGNLTLTGPAVANTGPVNSESIAVQAVNTSTGAVTLAANTQHAYVSGSLAQPADGSQAIVTVLCEGWGLSVVDQLMATRVDVECKSLLAAGGTLYSPMLVGYPADTALRAYVKAAIRTACPGVNFSDDFFPQ